MYIVYVRMFLLHVDVSTEVQQMQVSIILYLRTHLFTAV